MGRDILCVRIVLWFECKGGYGDYFSFMFKEEGRFDRFLKVVRVPDSLRMGC